MSDFVNERILLAAKRIMQFSSKSVKEISFDLGFDDSSYFSRFFKKHTALTPVQYRKMVNRR
jgi:AraC-like DNA-binding protein